MAYQEILPYLNKILELEYLEYFLIISPIDHDYAYSQFTLNSDTELYWEVVSNNFLPEQHQLGKTQKKSLINMGFSLGPNDVNYNQIIPIETEELREKLAKQVQQIFVEIFYITVSGFEIEFDS